MAASSLHQAINSDQFVVTAECVPPRSGSADGFGSCVSELGGAVDALYVPENEDGVRLSSLAAAAHVSSAEAEPIMALLTRDMNRIALQSTILGAASLGVKNVFCVTGRHQTLTDCPSAKGVFDIDPVQLIELANKMRSSGDLLGGRKMDSGLELLLGTDTNPFSEPVELQVMTMEKAVAAGADFIITQPVFNLDKLNIWMSYVRERELHTRCCIIGSVMPLTSSKEAVALAEKYTHLDIRDEDVDRLTAAQDQRAAGVHLAAETVNYFKKVEGLRGVHIMCGEDPSLAIDVINESGLSRS